MSLKKVTLKNFRTCENVELADLGHLTVLMGRNGVGKTNILQGIEWMAQTASTSIAINRKSLYDVPSVHHKDFFGQMVFSVIGINYRYTLNFLVSEFHFTAIEFGLQESLEQQDDSNNWQIVLRRDGEKIVGVNGEPLAEIHEAMPMMPAIVALKPSSETKNNILPALDYLRGINYYSLDERTSGVFDLVHSYYTRHISRDEYLKWISKSKDNFVPLGSVNMRILHMCFERRVDFDEMNEILGSNGLGVLNSIDINSFTMSSSGQTKELPLPVSDDNNNIYYFVDFIPGKGWEGADVLPRLPYQKLSAGTRRIIRILVSFFYDRNSLFLFEQPEDAIHPGLLRKLIDLLRGYDDKGQLIMTSHSSDLFNALKPEEVRLVTMEGGATQVRALSETEMAGAKRFINEEGSLSNYLHMLETD
jgi:predicted ATPase